jgi:hypothetical protein
VLILLLTAGTAAAQQAKGAPMLSERRGGVIRGRVVRADTGEPLRRVIVRVADGAPAICASLRRP